MFAIVSPDLKKEKEGREGGGNGGCQELAPELERREMLINGYKILARLLHNKKWSPD